MIIERADRALYYVKENGRNQIRSYEQLVVRGALAAPQSQLGGDIEMSRAGA
jgi:hypothetical protein